MTDGSEEQVLDFRNATEDTLRLLITGQWMESSELEFKSADTFLRPKNPDHLRDELSKDVSSFANSNGGTIFLGIDEVQHQATSLRGIPPSILDKERLEQLIFSNMSPRILDLHIRPVPLVQTEPGTFAYVIAVPKGTTAHQARDKRYYRRYNFRAVPMEDYEVRDVMNRARGPALRLVLGAQSDANQFVWSTEAQLLHRPEGIWSNEVGVQVRITNTGNIALYSLFHLYVPLPDEEVRITVPETVRLVGRIAAINRKDRLPHRLSPLYLLYTRTWMIPNDPPIFSDTSTIFATLSVQLGQYGHIPLPAERTLLWQCRAPEMEPTQGGILLQVENSDLRIDALPDHEVDPWFAASPAQ